MKKVIPRDWPYVGLIFMLTCVYFAPLTLMGLDPYDEGIRLSGIERVLAGEVPYHDFYALYGPGHFYAPAALFRVFGAQVASLRFLSLAGNALGAVAVFSFSRAAGLGVRGALISYVLFLLPRFESGVQLYLCDPSLALILLAGTLLVSRSGFGLSEFLAGMLLGVAALFRQDFGVYGFIASVVAITLSLSPFSVSNARRQLTLLALAAFVVSGISYGLLALRGVEPLFDCLIRYPSLATSFRRLPYPAWAVLQALQSPPWTPAILVYLAPPATAVLVLVLVAPVPRRRILGAGRPRAALAFALALALGLCVYGFGRCDFQHLFPLYVVCILVWSVLLQSCVGPISPWIVSAFLGVGAVVASAMFVDTLTNYVQGCPVPLAKARLIVVSSPEREPMIQAARELTQIGGSEPIFVASDRHDRVYINPLTIYFLAGRLPGTYFAHFDPGVTTTRQVQQAIIDDLRRKRVRLVVKYRISLPDEPNQSRVSSGVTLLDDYLTANFSPIIVHPEYCILSLQE